MSHPRPLTSQEVDDGWRLEEEPPYESYALSGTYDAFSEAYAVLIEERPPAPEPEPIGWPALTPRQDRMPATGKERDS